MLTYGKTVKTAAGIYSIDKLLIETWLPLSFQFEFNDLKNTFYRLGTDLVAQGYEFTHDDFESKVWVQSRYRYRPPECDSGVIVELLKRTDPRLLSLSMPDGDGGLDISNTWVPTLQYGVRIQFNPNKHYDSDVVRRYFRWFRDLQDKRGVMWRVRRCDYAFDVELPILDVLMVSQKEASYYRGTRYFGQRGRSGYTRIYDKAKREKYDGVLTRFEWEQHNEELFTFDPPLIVGDLPRGYSWVKYIQFDCINECLADMDKRIRSKIKRTCFQPIDFNPSIFQGILLDYINELGLDPVHHHLSFSEHMDRVVEELLNSADITGMEKAFYQ